MPLITTTMPSLTGGVSQQPSSQRLMNQCEAQENAMPLLIGGLIKRPPTEHVAEVKSGTNSIDHSNSFSHIVTRDAEEEFMVLMDGSGAVSVVDTKGVNKTVYQDLGDSTYLQSSTPKTSFKAISIADVTFLVNTDVEVAMDSTKSPYSRGATAAKHEALIWIKTAGYGTEFKVYSGASVVASFTGTSTAANPQPGSNDVAKNLVDDSSPPAGSSASEFNTGTYNATNKGSVVHVERGDGAAFEMTVEDSLGDSAHSLIKSNEDGIMVTTNFNELPGIAIKDMIVKVEGDPDKEVDDYYVKFVPNDGSTTSLANGIWEETVAPNVEFKYDYNTLPHILIRQSDGTFLVKRTNGATPPATADANAASAEMDFKSRPASWNGTTMAVDSGLGASRHARSMSITLKSTDGTERIYAFTNFNRDGNACTTGDLDTEDRLGSASTGDKCLVRCMLTPELQAEQFAYAVNSANGHNGKIIATAVGSKVTLTQLVGGEEGNTEIIYGDMVSPRAEFGDYYWSDPASNAQYSFPEWSFYGGGSPDFVTVTHATNPSPPNLFGFPPVDVPVYNNDASRYFIGGYWEAAEEGYNTPGNPYRVRASHQGILDSQTIDDSATISAYYLYNPELGNEVVKTVREFGRGQWTTTIGNGALDVLEDTPYNFTGGVTGDEDDGDGSPDYVPAGSDYSSFKWADRAAGDDETNPLPSFVSKKINDISFFKNRLVVLAGENAIMSEVGGYFNFFRVTVTSLLDSAVIDVGVGGTEVNELFQATPFSDRLILFSTRTQFALQGEAVLSPATASISQVTNFDVDTSVDPFTVGPSLFFAFNRGTFSGIREFYRTGDSAIQFDAMEASAQVPRYIKGPITKISASSHEDVVVMLGSEKDTLYIYKYFKTESGSLQSAWGKFILNNTSIVDMRFVGQSLFLVVVRDNKTYIEEMKIQTGLRDEGKDFTTLLDRRTVVTTSATDPGFTLTLPTDYLIAEGDDMQVVDDSGELMTIESYTAGTNTITLKEELSPNTNYYVGVPYTMRYEISKPVLKRPKQGGGIEVVAVGRHQLRYMTVVYDDTSTFKVRVTPEIGNSDGEAVEYEFSGRFLSAGGFLGSRPTDTGDFRFPVFAESNSVKIEIINDTPLPSNLQAITFEASYSARSRPSGL